MKTCARDPAFLMPGSQWLINPEPWGWSPGSPVHSDSACGRSLPKGGTGHAAQPQGGSLGRRQRAVLALPGPLALSLLLCSPPCQLTPALSQMIEMLSVPRSLLPAPHPLAPGGAQALRRSPAALSVRAEAEAPGPVLCPPGRADLRPRAATPAASSPRAPWRLPALHSWRQIGQSQVPWRERRSEKPQTQGRK